MERKEIAVAALAVAVGPAEDTEPFVTAAFEGVAIVDAAAPGDAQARAAQLLGRCLQRLPEPGGHAPTVFILGDLPEPPEPSTRTVRMASLAEALGHVPTELVNASSVVVIACEGNDGAAVGLMPVTEGVPAIARIAAGSAEANISASPGLTLEFLETMGELTNSWPAWPALDLPPALRDLLLVAEGAVCLHRRVLPARPRTDIEDQLEPTDQLSVWPSAADGPRCVEVVLSAGRATQVLLVEAPEPRPPARTRIADRPTLLLPFRAGSTEELADQLAAVAGEASGDLRPLARQAFLSWRQRGAATVAAGVVADSMEQLRSDADFFVRQLRGADTGREWRTPSGSVLTTQPDGGDVAFVYPGFASAYENAGRRLGYYFPQLQDSLLATFGARSAAYLHLELTNPRGIRSSARPALDSDIRALCEATTSLASIYTALAREVFHLTPQRAFGYSIGEAAMSFALGLWREPDTMARHLDSSGMLDRRLVGEMRTVRDYWASAGTPVAPTAPAWACVLAHAPVADIATVAAAEPGCFVPLINTPHEAVLAGHPEAVDRAAAALSGRITPLEPALPLHCAAMRSERDAFFDQHDMPTHAADVTIYSSSTYKPVELDRQSLAAAVADSYTHPVDFPRLVRQVYADGAKVFVEMGPRRICCTWIDEILSDRPHVAVPLDLRGVGEEVSLLRALARLVAHQVPVTLDSLYESPEGVLSAARPSRTVSIVPQLTDASVEEITDLIVREVADLLSCPSELVSPEASLLELGIDSLAIVNLVDRAEHEHGVRIELADLVEAGTIRGIAELIDARRLTMTLAGVSAGEGDRGVLRI
jgi:PfaB family protein